MHQWFATTSLGLEPALSEELGRMGATSIAAQRGGVAFEGSLEVGYRANLWARSAIRVLRPVARFTAHHADQLYDGARSVRWADWVPEGRTLAVWANTKNTPKLHHSKFCALRVKDAICDQLRDTRGTRPDIDIRSPDIGVHLHLDRGRATVSVDTSGESLHRRGYRLARTEAPLREHLAAGLILLSGWDPSTTFADPMCGSATLVIEAAMIAANFAPGLDRARFGFMNLGDWDPSLWQRLIAEAQQARGTPPAPIAGSDIDRGALRVARANASRAGVDVSLTEGALADFEPPTPGGPGVILMNPPYGERLGDEARLEPLYRQIGDTFKQRCAGYSGWVFTGNRALSKRIGLRPKRRIPAHNGPIECRLLGYDLYAGRRSEPVSPT